ncbi:hypothetical protein OF83DRAFT_373645 [Amylostereum chailletii]|nr:hypothetical protein OF83DRAFT_373645 [Amylostereum chailletii]
MQKNLWPLVGGSMGWVNFNSSEGPLCAPVVADRLQHVYRCYVAAFDEAYHRSWCIDAQRSGQSNIMLQEYHQSQQPLQQHADRGLSSEGQQQPQQWHGLSTLSSIPPRILNEFIAHATLPAADLRARGLREQTIDNVERIRELFLDIAHRTRQQLFHAEHAQTPGEAVDAAQEMSLQERQQQEDRRTQALSWTQQQQQQQAGGQMFKANAPPYPGTASQSTDGATVYGLDEANESRLPDCWSAQSDFMSMVTGQLNDIVLRGTQITDEERAMLLQPENIEKATIAIEHAKRQRMNSNGA